MYIPKTPMQLGINITNRCNQRCKYCVVNGGELHSELEHTYLIKLLNDAYAFGIQEITFSGGEPLLYPNFMDIVETYSKKFKMNILTNGSLIDKDIAKRLCELSHKNRISVRISLDGASPEIHELFRGNGTFGSAIEGIKNLSKYDTSVAINTVIHKNNINYLQDLLSFLKSMNVKVVRVLPLIPMGRGVQLNQYIIDRHDWWNLLKARKSLERKLKMIILVESPLDFLVNPSQNSEANPCIAGYLYLGILPNGDVFPCPYMMDVVIGNIKKNALLDIWSNSHILAELRDPNMLKGSCKLCQYKEKCRGGCRGFSYYVQGDYLYPDPYCPIAIQNKI